MGQALFETDTTEKPTRNQAQRRVAEQQREAVKRTDRAPDKALPELLLVASTDIDGIVTLL